MENSEFDKYIKTHTEKELEVPVGLSWEEMDIPLPEQKKKRRGFFWIWFLFLGALLGGGAVMLLQPSIDESKDIVMEEVVATNRKPETKPILEKSSSNTGQKDDSVTKESTSTIINKDITVTNTRPSISKNTQPINSFNSLVSSNEITISNSGSIPENSLNSVSKKYNPITPSSSKEIIRTIFSVENIDGVNLGLSTKERALPQLHLVDIPPPDKKINASFFINFGVNQSWSNYNQGNQLATLTAAEDLAFGNSFQLGVKFPLKNKFFVTTGLTYQKLHTTFSYKEDLGTEVSLALNQRITRVKNIYHNNYFEFIELNLGVGKEFYFGKNWGSQLSLSFNPSYQLKATGRTLNEDLSVFEMENHKTVDRLLWAAGGGLDLFFNLKSNRILAGVDLKRSLSKIQLLDNSDLQLQPQVLTFKLGLERKF